MPIERLTGESVFTLKPRCTLKKGASDQVQYRIAIYVVMHMMTFLRTLWISKYEVYCNASIECPQLYVQA